MNNENFRRIYEKYREFSIRTACKIVGSRTVAEDICQEVFFHLYEISDTLDFSNERMIRSLIFTATGNKCKDYFKKPWKKHEDVRFGAEEYESVSDERTDPEKMMIRREEMDYRKRVLEKLRRENPMNYDILIKTKYFEIPPDFVAEEYGITRNNVNNRVLRTKKWIRREMEKLMKKRI